MQAAARCDSPRYFGAKKQVESSRLFPKHAARLPVMRLLADQQKMDALYDELARLLSRPDALDPESDTARELAAVEAELDQYERAEAELLRAELDARLPIPIDQVVALNEELADVIARARDRAAANPAADNS
jgi:hypothetical protein